MYHNEKSIRKGDIGLLKASIFLGADIHGPTMYIHPLVYLFTMTENYDIAKYLLDQGIINSKSVAIKIIGDYQSMMDTSGSLSHFS